MSDAPVRYSITAVQRGCDVVVERLVRELAPLGAVASDERDPAAPPLPQILVSPEVSGPLLNEVSTRRGHRRGQVLVITTAPVRGAAPLWQLLRCGADDVLCWRSSSGVQEVMARLHRWWSIEEILHSPEVTRQIIGASPPWSECLRRVIEIAYFTSSSLLVTGETGTGKELVARLFHHLDARPSKGDLVVVDCTTVVPTLAGSEFFGHERGAFTGASAAREGAFAAADRGTLFLDEVGELPLELQAELLRVVQEGTYKRVGSNTWQRTQFRLVSATNRDLAAEISERRFRQDLYYRIAANVVHLPPMGERRDDIVPLFRHFLADSAGEALEIEGAVESWVRQRRFPGNVRDLKQLAARIAAHHVGPGPVTLGDIPHEEWAEPGQPDVPEESLFEAAARAALLTERSLHQIKQDAGDAAVRVAIAETGTLKEAARRLGVTERALQLRRADRGSPPAVTYPRV